eukprot:scaffold6280_cov127-Skeletonema_marinoi.AAC.11
MTQEDTAASRSGGHLSERSDLSSVVVASAEIELGVDDANSLKEAADTIDDAKEEEFDVIKLPESTHTLLFTAPIKSPAFRFSFTIAALSILCLLLALSNNIILRGGGEIPANVGMAVKVAQYASIFIALLMEEEIPTGLYLLRRISKRYFKSKFPELCYHKFVASCILRICVGYLFLVNVLFILMRAREVLDIFFDFIALQFLQQLDDIAFNLARMGVFSKSLRAETTNKYFRTEFKKEVDKAEKSRRISLFLIYVSRKQSRGDYQCKSITVIIKDEVWEESVVQVPGKDIEKMVLIYPYFNGHYNQDGSSHDGRPVYVEQNKFDGTEFSTKVPAQIKYCKSIRAWVFTHEYIQKSKSTRDDSACPWLLRSEETDVFDIEEVQGPWQIWAGVIGRTDVDIVCNQCSVNADCNLNGVCKNDGKCECYNDEEGVTFIGPHCEVRLKDDCRTIYGELYNDTWSVIPTPWDDKGLWQSYDRPVYRYQGGNPLINDTDVVVLVYSGDRWFGVRQRQGERLFSEEGQEFLKAAATNYHAFWDRALQNGTVVVSDATTKDTPVGVDFYRIGERGDQFGPYGALYPLQLNNQTGRGVFRCTASRPFVYADALPFPNITGSGRRISHTEELFDTYLWLGDPN